MPASHTSPSASQLPNRPLKSRTDPSLQSGLKIRIQEVGLHRAVHAKNSARGLTHGSGAGAICTRSLELAASAAAAAVAAAHAHVHAASLEVRWLGDLRQLQSRISS